MKMTSLGTMLIQPTRRSSVMNFMKAGFHSRTRSTMKPAKIQLKPLLSRSAECSTQQPRLSAPSVLRVACHDLVSPPRAWDRGGEGIA